MKACAYCGRENTDDTTQCVECGTNEFKESPPDTPPAELLSSLRRKLEALKLDSSDASEDSGQQPHEAEALAAPVSSPGSPDADTLLENADELSATDLGATKTEEDTSTPDVSRMFVVSSADGKLVPPSDPDKFTTDFYPGLILDERYRLERKLGHGGMGLVFLATDQRLDRQVAIKVILAKKRQDDSNAEKYNERLREKFEKEAKYGAGLKHPSLATVHDYGFHRENPYAVFEYIEGESLQMLLRRRRRIPPEEVRLMVAQLASGLDYAHAHHIVHADLKPGNICTTKEGDLKILDFGLATSLSSLENRKRYAGTPAYSSPEQASTMPLDGRSDQYTLALIVYEMLVGDRPFGYRTEDEYLRLHVNVDVPLGKLQELNLPGSDEFVNALHRALSKDPSKRYPDCETFAAALRCQLVSDAPTAPSILLETRVRCRLDRRLFRLSDKGYLVLTPDALWFDDEGEIHRWPISSINRVSHESNLFQQSTLLLTFSGLTLSDIRLHFAKPAEFEEWSNHLNTLKEIITPSKVTVSSAREVFVVPILRTSPPLRLQLLGPAAGEGGPARVRKSALRIRAAMLRADAVVDVADDTTPGASRRTSGTAVRAIDTEGRRQLSGCQYKESVDRVTKLMLLAVGAYVTLITFKGVIQFVSHGSNPIYLVGPTKDVVLLWLWPALMTILFRTTKWPQLVGPLGIAFANIPAVKVVGIGALMIALLGPLGVVAALVGTAMSGVFYAIPILALLAMMRRGHRVFLTETKDQQPAEEQAAVWGGRICLAISIIAVGGSWAIYVLIPIVLSVAGIEISTVTR